LHWQERGKYSEKLSKWALDDIHKFMDLLDIPRGSGNKVRSAGHPFSFVQTVQRFCRSLTRAPLISLSHALTGLGASRSQVQCGQLRYVNTSGILVIF